MEAKKLIPFASRIAVFLSFLLHYIFQENYLRALLLGCEKHDFSLILKTPMTEHLKGGI